MEEQVRVAEQERRGWADRGAEAECRATAMEEEVKECEGEIQRLEIGLIEARRLQKQACEGGVPTEAMLKQVQAVGGVLTETKSALGVAREELRAARLLATKRGEQQEELERQVEALDEALGAQRGAVRQGQEEVRRLEAALEAASRESEGREHAEAQKAQEVLEVVEVVRALQQDLVCLGVASNAGEVGPEAGMYLKEAVQRAEAVAQKVLGGRVGHVV